MRQREVQFKEKVSNGRSAEEAVEEDSAEEATEGQTQAGRATPAPMGEEDAGMGVPWRVWGSEGSEALNECVLGSNG